MTRYTDRWHYYCKCGREHHMNDKECECGDLHGVGRLHPDDEWGQP